MLGNFRTGAAAKATPQDFFVLVASRDKGNTAYGVIGTDTNILICIYIYIDNFPAFPYNDIAASTSYRGVT